MNASAIMLSIITMVCIAIVTAIAATLHGAGAGFAAFAISSGFVLLATKDYDQGEIE